MRVELDIWRQNGPDAKGHFEHHIVEDAEPEWSLLELLDRLNDQIVENDGDPIVFESDCREGCLLYTSPSPRDKRQSRMPSSA